jgi:hypothetical protein
MIYRTYLLVTRCGSIFSSLLLTKYFSISSTSIPEKGNYPLKRKYIVAPKAQTSDLTEVKLEVYYSGDAKFGEKPFEVLDVVFSIK